MKNFWINNTENVSFSTYENLLNFFQADSKIHLNYKGKDVSILYANLLKSLLYGYDYILLDPDFSDDEIQKLMGSIYEEHLVNVTTVKFLDWEDVLTNLKESKANIVLYSSGTTGVPKKVLQPLANLIRDVRQGEKYCEHNWGFAYNPTHMAGLQVFFQAIFNQNPLINLFNCKRDSIYELIETEQISHISATPTFYRLLLPFRKTYLSVKRITFGGERSNSRLYDQMSHIFPNAKISNIYASTEAGTLLSSSGESFYIPETKKDLIRIHENELLIHKSLLGKVEDTSLVNNGWYLTGDLVEWIDAKHDGFIFLSRKSEMINVGGYKVNPQEVEEVLNNLDGVQSCRVYGRKNSVIGNVLMADIVWKNDTDGNEQTIKEFLSIHLQNFKVPRKILFVDALNQSRTGKIIRT